MSLETEAAQKGSSLPVIPARPAPAPQKKDEPKVADAPKVADDPKVSTEPAAEPAEEKLAKPRKKIDWGGLALDTLLVLMLGAVLGGGGWYLNRELTRYHIPSPMEQAGQLNLELCQKRESMQNAAYHADEQLHMRKRLSVLQQKSDELGRKIEAKKQSLEVQKQKVLTLQHDIRQEDKSARSVARSLLPGMAIGDAKTKDGKLYRNAVIYRLEGKKITISTPEGQMRFPLVNLVKEDLPDIARYAFGLDDMVDMSDFEVTADQPAPKPRKGKLIAAKTKTEGGVKDYDPASGAPVVDTDANKTSTLTAPLDTEGTDSGSEDTSNTDLPEGDLPF